MNRASTQKQAPVTYQPLTDMSRMFKEASSFNSDLSNWDVSGATTMYGMFGEASSFNGDLSAWDVSGVADMDLMFDGARSFEQNLGNWYIVLGDTSIGYGDATRQVTTISPQNAWIGNNQNVAYSIGGADDGDQFEIDGNALKLKSVPNGAKSSYNLTIRSTGDFGTGNSKTVTVTVTGIPANMPPAVEAGPDQTVQEGSAVTLSGTATDDDGDDLTYSWTHDSSLAITMSDDDTLSPSFAAPQVDSNTTVTFTLTVSDGTTATSDSLDVTIANSNAAPVEPPVTPSGPRDMGEITLASSQPGTIQAAWDAPGETPRDYRVAWAKVGESFLGWRNLDGNAFPTSPSHTIAGLEEGEQYQVKVRARYGSGGPGDWSGVVTITVAGTG